VHGRLHAQEFDVAGEVEDEAVAVVEDEDHDGGMKKVSGTFFEFE
jgi:hypothetical protein